MIRTERFRGEASAFPCGRTWRWISYDRCRAYFIEGGAPFVPVEETLRVMEILEECRTGAPVRRV